MCKRFPGVPSPTCVFSCADRAIQTVFTQYVYCVCISKSYLCKESLPYDIILLLKFVDENNRQLLVPVCDSSVAEVL